MATKDTTTLLQGILNVVSRTEKHIAQINKNTGGGNTTDDGGIASAVKGSATGDSVSSSKVEQKLDTIIDLLETHVSASENQTNILGGLASGINILSRSLGKFKKASKSSGLFVSFLERIKQPLEDLGTKEVSQGVKNVEMIGNAIRGVAGNMLKAALIMIPVIPLLPLIATGLWGISKIYTFIGEKSKEIRRGSRAVDRIGDSMKSLGIGIAILSLSAVASSVALSAFGFPTGALGLIAGFALTLTLLGSSRAVRRGVRTLKDMGKGMLFLAGGIAILSLTFALSTELMAGSGMTGMLAGGVGIIAAIGGLALTMIVLGLPPVAKGARTMKGMGIGMLFLAGGIAIMGLTFAYIGSAMGISPIEVGGGIALSLLGIGGAMFLMGKMSTSIIKGSVAMLITSVAFILFGVGMSKSFKALSEGPSKGKDVWGDLGKLGAAVGGLALGVTLLGNPITFGFTLMGAAALGAVGLGMIAIGKGLAEYNKLGAYEFDGDKFKDTMLKLNAGFMALLGDDGEDKGFWGAIKSVGKAVVGGSKLTIAVTTAMGMGQALSSVAKGVGAWANLQNIPIIEGYDKNGMPIYTGEKANIDVALQNITDYLPKIIQPFIDLSNQADLNRPGGFSITKMLLGRDLGQSPFEIGISASLKMGKVLSSMAEGVGAWGNIQKIPIIKSYDKDGNPIYGNETASVSQALSNISMVVPEIMDIFVQVSKNEQLKKPGGFSISKILLGADLGQSPFEIGISAALKIGKVLSSFAEGIGGFGNLQSIPIIKGYDEKGNPIYGDPINLTTATSNIGKGISEVIKAIITSTKESDDVDYDDVEDLSEAVAPILGALGSFAEGVNTFADLQAIKVIDYIDPETGKPVYKKETVNITDVAKNIGTALTTIVKEMGKLENADDGDIEDGIENFSNFTDVVERIADSATDFEKFANSFKTLSTSMSDFASNFNKIDTDPLNTFTVWSQTLTSLAKLNAGDVRRNLQEVVDTLTEKMADTQIEKTSFVDRTAAAFGLGSEAPKSAVKTEDKQTATWERMTQTMEDLRDAIDEMSDKLDLVDVRVMNTVKFED